MGSLYIYIYINIDQYTIEFKFRDFQEKQRIDCASPITHNRLKSFKLYISVVVVVVASCQKLLLLLFNRLGVN